MLSSLFLDIYGALVVAIKTLELFPSQRNWNTLLRLDPCARIPLISA